MTIEERLQARRQLANCFVDLGKRAEELDEPYIQCIALVVAGTILECSDDRLSFLLANYAQTRLDEDKEKKSNGA